MPNDLLSQLRDVHTPTEVISAWPLAWGWWVLFALLLLCAAAVFLLLRHYQKNRYRRLALKELEQLVNIENPHNFLYQVALLIKAVAIQTQANTAQLHGSQWQIYLQQHMPEDVAYTLANARYQPQVNIDKRAILQAVKQWIKAHK